MKEKRIFQNKKSSIVAIIALLRVVWQCELLPD